MGFHTAKMRLGGLVLLGLGAQTRGFSLNIRRGARLAATSVRVPAETQAPVQASSIPELKAQLREALDLAEGQTWQPEVMSVVDQLAALNPTARMGYHEELEGRWRLVSAPEFPGFLGRDPENRYVYNLGRLCFDLFEPREQLCCIDKVDNHIGVPAFGEDNFGMEYTYTNVMRVRMISAEGETLLGRMENKGFASPNAANPDRLEVIFTEGNLTPVDGTNLEAWRATFGPSAPVRKRDRLSRWMLKKRIGLVPPEHVAYNGELRYEIQRPPEGFSDILYLDDELRITKGSQGTVVVVEKVSGPPHYLLGKSP